MPQRLGNSRRLGRDSLAISAGFAVRAVAQAAMFVIVRPAPWAGRLPAALRLGGARGSSVLLLDWPPDFRVTAESREAGRAVWFLWAADGRGEAGAQHGGANDCAVRDRGEPVAACRCPACGGLVDRCRRYSDHTTRQRRHPSLPGACPHRGSALITALPSIAKLVAALLLMVLAPSAPGSPLAVWSAP